MGFLYSLFLKLLCPTCLTVLLLLASALLRRWKVSSRVCFWVAIAILLFCGNGWIARSVAKCLERQYLPTIQTPQADCIVVLGGGTSPADSPRPTVEVGEAGDRILYGAHLYRQGKAPCIVCTGGVATGGIALRPYAEDMAELLRMIGISQDVIITEVESQNTHDHAVYLRPLFKARGIKRILLVTSAMHMPRAMGVFKRGCPELEVFSAPTDFLAPDKIPAPWYREVSEFFPTPQHLVMFSDSLHEYLEWPTTSCVVGCDCSTLRREAAVTSPSPHSHRSL